MIGDWFLGVGGKQMKKILVGVATLCWTIWPYQNDITFDKQKHTTFMQVIFRGAYWLRHWVLLQEEEEREPAYMTCRALEVVAMEFFAKHGWRFSNRLCVA